MSEPPTESAISEETLLRAEAERARVALHGALLSVKDSLLHTADPKVWAQTHPWVSVGVAAATGFAAATAIVPSRGERASEHWSNLLHRWTHHSDDNAVNGLATPSSTEAPVAAPSIWTSIVNSLFDLAKVAITNFITTTMQARATTANADATDLGSQNPSSSQLRAD